MSLLAQLNPQQREAVLHDSGPLLVLAGAGSGKTRVITYRVAHLIAERSVEPENILAVTFTNKAAEEMHSRVVNLLEGQTTTRPVVCTFHSFCLRILRRHIQHLGYPNDFTIYDVDDQVALMRNVCKELNCNSESPRQLQARISFAKNSKYGPESLFDHNADSQLLDIYHAYQKALKTYGAVDFDDLLLLANKLLDSVPQVLQRQREQFRHLLVDEYQDTNFHQYQLIQKLAHPDDNVCAVGDDDQSIYRWRGADITNILNFSKDFPGTRVIKLEQNYRSTQHILDAAHGIVENLLGRHPKKLWTDRGAGDLVQYFQGDDEGSEASHVVRNMNDLLKSYKPSGFAVLYRTNAQSRAFEEALGRHKIPYQLVGGTRFFDRKEIKDVLAYIQFAVNPADEVSFRRIVNNPHRGIGDVSIGKVNHRALRKNITPWQVITDQLKFLDITAAARKSLEMFREMMLVIQEHIEHGDPPSEIIDFVLKESEYLGALIKEGTEEAMGRIDNLRELIASAKSFESLNPHASTREYLDQVSLVADTDEYEPGAPRAVLMTLHSAKGLEFPVVFLTGLEEGLLPHGRNLDDPEQLEEERRLCYVGMTRARDKLFLTGARGRRTFEGFKLSKPSRFIDDIPPAVLDERGVERSFRKRRKTTVGANIDNIGKFFKDKKIDIDVHKLKKHEPGKEEGEFRKGDEVFLEKYGQGRIMALEGEGQELRYIVYFPKIGQRKKLLARVAKLKKV
jgi:DNA helicase-2/ATP-dependent DNA helicase PcrA